MPLPSTARETSYIAGETSSNEPTFPVKAGPDLTANGDKDAFIARVSYWDIWHPTHAVGDFDGDGADEAAMDFGASGAGSTTTAPGSC